MRALKMYLGDIPIVSLDRIYLDIDLENVYFLDCTRVDNSKKLVSRNNKYDVDTQIKRLSYLLKLEGFTKIVLADDVVFSGSVLKTVISKFKENNIEVIGIRSSVATIESLQLFEYLPLKLDCGYLLGSCVIDEICERDFYFGVAGSGIVVKTNDGFYKSPYFKPFGNPIDRASIKKEYEVLFSNSCINRSILLWEEIERLSNRKFYLDDLPEKILGTGINDEVIKVLKKGKRYL